jgi:5-methyltetrahydrofolate--homocysteine methyltransferase
MPVEAVFEQKGERRPLMVSVTMETTGTMLVGSDITAVVSILEPYAIDILGLNCATGPDLMTLEHVKYLSETSPFVVSCIPNAGLPEKYRWPCPLQTDPDGIADGPASVCGRPGRTGDWGLLWHPSRAHCGAGRGGKRAATQRTLGAALPPHHPTPPLHHPTPRPALNYTPSAASIYGAQPYEQDNSFLIVGERLNASGSRKVRELLNEDDWDGLIAIAKQQVKEGAHILDVNVDYVGRDGERDMHELVSRLVTNVTLPLMLDSHRVAKDGSGPQGSRRQVYSQLHQLRRRG